jgi:CRISPR-associated endonuclease/helicase Cas3
MAKLTLHIYKKHTNNMAISNRWNDHKDEDIANKLFERLKLVNSFNGVSEEEFVAELNRIIHSNPSKNILVIMNTISSAVSVFKRVKVPEEEKFHISSEMGSDERQQRITIISDRLKRRKRTILISNQGGKANIYFDFDIVFRDLAPIDLMKQEIMVRHNHNNENTSSREVYVFAMYDDSINYFANRIYGNALIEKTREALL